MTYGQRGAAYESEGNYDQAIEDFDEGLKLKPNEAALYGERGLAYSDKGNVQLALQDYATAIRLKPDAEANYVNRAGTYIYQLKDYDRALADLDIALKLDPNDATTYSLRAARLVSEEGLQARDRGFERRDQARSQGPRQLQASRRCREPAAMGMAALRKGVEGEIT